MAAGGEPYGNPRMKYRAKKGQWICRNPKNGHCWIMDDEGMFEFYTPLDKTIGEWKALYQKIKSKEKQQKIKKKTPGQAKKKATQHTIEIRDSLFYEDDV